MARALSRMNPRLVFKDKDDGYKKHLNASDAEVIYGNRAQNPRTKLLVSKSMLKGWLEKQYDLGRKANFNSNT